MQVELQVDFEVVQVDWIILSRLKIIKKNMEKSKIFFVTGFAYRPDVSAFS